MTETIVEKNIETIETVKEKPYHFRRLKAEDVPAMLRIVGKIGLNEFKSVFTSDGIKDIIGASMNKDSAGAKSAEEIFSIAGLSVALEIANMVCCNLPRAEKEIFVLLASVAETSEKDVRDLDFVVFMEMLIDFFRKEEFPDFFKVVSKLFK